MEIWDNANMCLFVAQNEGPPVYLQHVGIERVAWRAILEETCQCCGSVMDEAKCTDCGADTPIVGRHFLGCATMTLEGALPQAIAIFHLQEGAELLLCHKCRGDRSQFEPRDVIMRFLHCHWVAKIMPHVAALCPEHQERLWVFVTVECDVEMYPDGMLGAKQEEA